MGAVGFLLFAQLSLGLSPSETTQTTQKALAYARKFTAQFVADSCTEKCQFISDPEHDRAATARNGNIVVDLEGRRRISTAYHVKENRVHAQLTLKPVEDASQKIPFGMVVLDFQFKEGDPIPIPTK